MWFRILEGASEAQEHTKSAEEESSELLPSSSACGAFPPNVLIPPRSSMEAWSSRRFQAWLLAWNVPE